MMALEDEEIQRNGLCHIKYDFRNTAELIPTSGTGATPVVSTSDGFVGRNNNNDDKKKCTTMTNSSRSSSNKKKTERNFVKQVYEMYTALPIKRKGVHWCLVSNELKDFILSSSVQGLGKLVSVHIYSKLLAHNGTHNVLYLKLHEKVCLFFQPNTSLLTTFLPNTTGDAFVHRTARRSSVPIDDVRNSDPRLADRLFGYY